MGCVVEVKEYDQYVVRMDGSGRFSLRNRKFLSKFIPVQTPRKQRSILEDLRLIPVKSHSESQPYLSSPKSTEEMIVPNEYPSSSNNSNKLPTQPSTIFHPPNDSLETSKPQSPVVQKLPLALHHLADHNPKGLKE